MEKMEKSEVFLACISGLRDGNPFLVSQGKCNWGTSVVSNTEPKVKPLFHEWGTSRRKKSPSLYHIYSEFSLSNEYMGEGRSPVLWDNLGERETNGLGCTSLEWSFLFVYFFVFQSQQGKEGMIFVSDTTDSHSSYQILVNSLG